MIHFVKLKTGKEAQYGGPVLLLLSLTCCNQSTFHITCSRGHVAFPGQTIERKTVVYVHTPLHNSNNSQDYFLDPAFEFNSN